MPDTKKYRFHAFLIHFFISIALVGVAIVAMYAAWYRAPFASLLGWYKLLWVILIVNIVLGPCLTFVVFVPHKKGLVFDLAVIGLVQLFALGYGAYTSFNGRPVYLVFLKDRFETVSASDYPGSELKAAENSAFLNFSWVGPQPVTAVMPMGEEAGRIIFSAISGGGIKTMPRYYQPYDTAAESAIASGKRLIDIQKSNPEKAREIVNWIHNEHKNADDVVFVPLQTKLGYGLAMLDSHNGKIVALKAIDPTWY